MVRAALRSLITSAVRPPGLKPLSDAHGRAGIWQNLRQRVEGRALDEGPPGFLAVALDVRRLPRVARVAEESHISKHLLRCLNGVFLPSAFRQALEHVSKCSQTAFVRP